MLDYNSSAQVDRLASFRSSLRATRSNNTFATATNLGVYRGDSVTFRPSGTLNNRNRVDFFKFRILRGASYSSLLDIANIRSGGLRLTTYADLGSGAFRVTQNRYSRGNYRFLSPGVSNYPVNATFYLKFDKPRGTTRYQVTSRISA